MRKETVVGIVGNETIIGSGVRVKGNLTSEHDIVVDGTLAGNIRTKGSITIGVNAVIKGNVIGRDVSIAGQLEGDIKAANQAQIQATGRVQGNVASASLGINPGGVFVGTSVMSVTPTALEASAQEAADDTEES